MWRCCCGNKKARALMVQRVLNWVRLLALLWAMWTKSGSCVQSANCLLYSLDGVHPVLPENGSKTSTNEYGLWQNFGEKTETGIRYGDSWESKLHQNTHCFVLYSVTLLKNLKSAEAWLYFPRITIYAPALVGCDTYVLISKGAVKDCISHLRSF